MNILIASSRNISRNEIYALAKALGRNHRVTIACMSKDSPMRGLSFSFSTSPTRVNRLQYKRSYGEPISAYEFYSTPADAVSIMLGGIMRTHPPDLVICGISNGTNMGTDVYPASNVGMAMEAALFGIPSVCVATTYKFGGHDATDLEPLATFVANNAERLAKVKLPPNTFLSINAPLVKKYDDFKGVRFTRMSKLPSRIEYVHGIDQLRRNYYWSKINQIPHQTDEDDDKTWYDRGFISITPICYDSSDFHTIQEMEETK